MVRRKRKLSEQGIQTAEVDLERQLAFAQTIMSPKYLEDKIQEYQDEIDRCKDMMKFYKKELKAVMNPDTRQGKLSRKYKLQ